MIPDSYTLPPGLAPSGIPGNSAKEIAVERAMEEAEHITHEVCSGLRYQAAQFKRAFKEDAEMARARIKILSSYLENIQSTLDDARDVLDEVLDEG